MVTNCWIFTFSYLQFGTGEKLHCTGDPLDPAEFSKEGDVGYIRDLCVDVVARNIYNTLQLPPSDICNELANMRTSTCLAKNICVKWKRSCFWNNDATKQVTLKAEELIEQLDDIFSKGELINDVEKERFLFEYIDDAKNRLINSKAVTKDSTIIEKFDSLKKYCCTRFQLGQYLKEYLVSTGRDNSYSMGEVDSLVKKSDVEQVIKLFIRNFEAENMVKIIWFIFTDSKDRLMESKGINSLKFKFKRDTETESSNVFMKIPRLYRTTQPDMTDALFDREAHFYGTILPNLYQLGKCTPFSAKSYGITDTRAFVMEDLSILGYEPGHPYEQLDMNQILISLISLAKYHALSYKYIRSLSDDDPRLSFIRTHPPIIPNNAFKHFFQKFTELMKRHLQEKLFQKIINEEDRISAEPRSLKYPDKNSMTVMIHGDYRTDNILLKKDDAGKVTEARIIDWQFSGEANPVLDLIYFLVTSVPVDIFEKNEDLLKDTYLNKLNQELKSVQSNRAYNRAELDRDMSYYSYYCLRVLFYHWPAIIQADDPVRQNRYMYDAAKWVEYLERKGMI